MTETAISVLICGFGAFGRLHADGWRLCDPAIRLFVADPSEAGQQRALQAGIAPDRISSDPAQFVGRVDIVDVVAPPVFHLPLALMGLQAGRPVMLEKPAVLNVAEAEKLMAAATTLPVQIGMLLRRHPLVARMRTLLAEGAIGRLVVIEANTFGWKRMRADSSLLENDGVHLLDLMRLFAGSAARTADAQATRHIKETVADDIRVSLGFDHGVTGRLRLGVLACGSAEDPFIPGAITTKTIRLIGTEGNLLLDFNTNRLTQARVSYTPSPGGYDLKVGAMVSEQVVGITPASLLAWSFRHFLNAVNTGSPVMCDIREGALDMARLLETIDRAQERSPLPPLTVPGDAP